MADQIKLNDKVLNLVTVQYPEALTGWQGIFRAKNDLENTSIPLIENKGTLSVSGSTTSVVFNIDLTGNHGLTSGAVYEVELNNASTIGGVPVLPPVFFEIGNIVLIKRLKKT